MEMERSLDDLFDALDLEERIFALICEHYPEYDEDIHFGPIMTSLTMVAAQLALGRISAEEFADTMKYGFLTLERRRLYFDEDFD